MSVSNASVHPVEAPPSLPAPAPEGTQQAPRVRMEDIQGMPATSLGLALRFFQFFFAAASLSVMASTNDFPSVSAFCYLVAATGLQSLWSLALATLDVYAIMVKRSLHNPRLLTLFAVGDGVCCSSFFSLQLLVSRFIIIPLNKTEDEICFNPACTYSDWFLLLSFCCCNTDKETY
ncbi:CASP-like protein 5A2 [Raphanus sativus]|nr:CASP-like protein 5A2 [Raphanus sativus]